MKIYCNSVLLTHFLFSQPHAHLKRLTFVSTLRIQVIISTGNVVVVAPLLLEQGRRLITH